MAEDQAAGMPPATEVNTGNMANRKRKALSVGEWVLVREDSRGW